MSIEEGGNGGSVPIHVMCCKGRSSLSLFFPTEAKMLPLNYGAARGQEMGQALIWAAKDCKTLHWNWSRCRDPLNPHDHKQPGHPFQCGIFISSVLGCGSWYWLDFHCRDGCVGIAHLRITMVLSALQSRQWWGTAVLETSFLPLLPVKAEHLEGRMVLQLGYWTGRTELQ